MSSYAQLAHQELLQALDSFTNAQESYYVPTTTHAMKAVELFMPLVTQQENISLKEHLALAQELPMVQNHEHLPNLLTNLSLYESSYYHDNPEVSIAAKEALLVLSLCNDILSELIPVLEN